MLDLGSVYEGLAHRLQDECQAESSFAGSSTTEYMTTNKGILVIKVGTDILNNPLAFSVIARQIAELKKEGFGVIVVSSGGVNAGSFRITVLGGNPEHYPKRLRAGIGARHLLNEWGEALSLSGYDVAQCYITYGNLRLKGEKENIRANLRRLAFDPIVVPLVNENDIVSGVEIDKMNARKKRQNVDQGDNDRLGRVTACLVDAAGIAFVTVKGGVYTANPDTDPSAKLIKRIDAKRRYRSGKKHAGTSQNGTGGMPSKQNQACICARKGMRAGIIGFNDISPFFRGEEVGTLVVV